MSATNGNILVEQVAVEPMGDETRWLKYKVGFERKVDILVAPGMVTTHPVGTVCGTADVFHVVGFGSTPSEAWSMAGGRSK